MDLEIVSKEEYVRVYQSLSGGYIDVHPLHGKDELPENMEACMILADHGHKIEMLPTISSCEPELRKKLLPDVFGSKNPDVRINGQLIGDIKTPEKDTLIKQSVISRVVGTAAKQKVEVAIVNLFDRVYIAQDVKKGIIGALQPDRNRSIQQVWVITLRRNLFTVQRQVAFNDLIYEVLIHL